MNNNSFSSGIFVTPTTPEYFLPAVKKYINLIIK